MLIDQFRLKEKSWHVWVMNYIWGFKSKDFTHMCPYFWLSALNIFIILPWIIIRSIFQLLGKVDKSTRSYTYNKKQTKRDKKSIEFDVKKKEASVYINNMLSNDTLLEKLAQDWIDSQYGKLCGNSIMKFISSRLYFGDYIPRNLSKRFQEIKLQREQYWERIWEKEADEKYEERLKRKAKIATIVKWVKPVGQVIIFVSALITPIVAFYLVGIGFNGLLGLSSVFWGSFRWWIGFVILCIAVFIAIWWIVVLIVNLFRSIDLSFTISCKWEKRWIAVEDFLLKYICGPIVWIARGIGNIFTIIGQMFRNNCPAIKWEK